LCDLQWSQVELATGRLHVRRAKNGSPSVHPMQGDEIRALRRLRREQGLSSHVFMSERDGPMTPKAFQNISGLPQGPAGRFRDMLRLCCKLAQRVPGRSPCST
jgi:integrase